MLTLFGLLKVNWAELAFLSLIMFCVFLGGCDENVERETPPHGRLEGEKMVTLTIDLQDGFKDDVVAVRVNGEEIFHKEQISTRLLLGLAASFKTEVEKGRVSIEIRVETRDIVKTISQDISADTYLGVSVANGKIEYIISDEPFRYA